MKERTIKKHAITEILSDGGVWWCPPKVRYVKEGDIFGVFDCVALYEYQVKFIQWTTLGNFAARRKKVRRFLEENDLESLSLNANEWVQFEIWGWNKKLKEFHKERV